MREIEVLTLTILLNKLMSFDSHSLERLRQLGRQLPKQITPPEKTNRDKDKQNQSCNIKLHPVETAEDPNRLFYELINISEDGSVPNHLINRLKDSEYKSKHAIQESKNRQVNRNINPDNKTNKNRYKNIAQEPNDLYISFKQLLLEDEI